MEDIIDYNTLFRSPGQVHAEMERRGQGIGDQHALGTSSRDVRRFVTERTIVN